MIENSNKYSGINIEILKIANYQSKALDEFLEQFKQFRKNIKQEEIIQKYGKIKDTQTLLEELNKLNEYDLDILENIAYRIEMDCRTFTSELKDCILDDIEVIRFNNLEKTSKFNVILDEMIQQVKSIAEDYGIKFEDEKELEE